jgi:hypothetical protein
MIAGNHGVATTDQRSWAEFSVAEDAYGGHRLKAAVRRGKSCI